jgi:hypothetical protein
LGNFAPTANVGVAQFDKINRATEFVFPSAALDLVLLCIDLDERTGTNQRIECVVVEPNVSPIGRARCGGTTASRLCNVPR